MRALWVVLFSVMMAGFTPASAQPEAALRFDGIYQGPQRVGEDGVPYWEYLRFYKDGTVIAANTTGTPEKFSSWFVRERALRSGKFTVAGGHLEFNTVSSLGVGSIEYSGNVERERLTLKWVSRMHRPQIAQSTDEYRFVRH